MSKTTSLKIVSKIKLKRYNNNPSVSYFFCPGCKEYHSVQTINPDINGTVYTITGSPENPTVTPMIVRVIEKFNKSKHSVEHICNGIITEGKIRFLENCTHGLAGKIVELPFVD